MLSLELRQQIRVLLEKYQNCRSNIIWAVDRFPHGRPPIEKPRVRVNAISGPLPAHNTQLHP